MKTTMTEVSDAVNTTDMPIGYADRKAIVEGSLAVQLRTADHLRDKLGMEGPGDSIVIELEPDPDAEEDYGTMYLYEVTWEKDVTVNDLGGLDQAKSILGCEEEAPRYTHVLQFLCEYRSLVLCSVEALGFRERGREESSTVNEGSSAVNDGDDLDLLF